MNKKIPSILAVLILIVGVGVGVFLLQSQQIFRLGASPTAEPRNVTITNVSDSSFTVSWTTDSPTVGYLKWGTTDLGNTTDTEVEKSNIHHITIGDLEPENSYQFAVYVDGQQKLNQQSNWQVETGPILDPPTKSLIISGKVVDSFGNPASQAIIYARVGNAATLSSVTSNDGQWFISMANARTQNKTAYASLDDQSKLELFIEAGTLGNSAAEILLGNANPTPDITLGQVYDFTDTNFVNDNSVPEAQIELPETEASQADSKFQLDDQQDQTPQEEVSVESIENNETIFTQTPEFFGTGPANQTITITVESDPITEDVAVDTSGNWSWEPPAGLEEGEHTLTITWRDASGILRSLTRTFVVQAAEGEPSFESTPSGTLTPSPSPSTSPSPSPSATPRVSKPATDSDIPVAGVWEPTIALAIAGFMLLSLGLYLSFRT